MENLKMIESSWETLREKTIPASAPDDLLAVMKTIFYSGNKNMLMIVNGVAKRLPEADAFVVLDNLSDEIDAHFKARAEKRIRDAG